MPKMAIIQKPTDESSRRRKRWREQGLAYLFLAPALFVMLIVSYYPAVQTILFSFQKVGLRGPMGWIGIENYTRLFGNPVFLTAWKNILVFIVLNLGLGGLGSLVLALMINEMRRLAPFFRMIIYLPALIPGTVAIIIWRILYQPEWGVLNNLFRAVGLPPQPWLQDPALVKPAMVIIMIWVGAGASTLIYLSALKDITKDIIEAAELEGLSPLQRIWHIVLPLMRTRIQMLLVFQVIAVAQIFTEPFLLTSGGPGTSTMTPALVLYNTAFLNLDFGLAAAWGVSMLVILSAFSVLAVWLRKADLSLDI
jgi:multiple sugar transport system permease protein